MKHKSLFFESNTLSGILKEKEQNLISEKMYKEIVKVLLNFNKMINIKIGHVECWRKKKNKIQSLWYGVPIAAV